MSNVLKCDRCGEIFAVPCQFAGRVTLLRGGGDTRRSNPLSDESPQEIIQKDLCASCVDRVSAAIKNK